MFPPAQQRPTQRKYETIIMQPDVQAQMIAGLQALSDQALASAGLSASDGWRVDAARGFFVRELVPATWQPAAQATTGTTPPTV